MAGDRGARRIARAGKWHELVERAGGSEEGAHRLIRESPEWAQSYEEYALGPFVFLDEARVAYVLDLMVAVDRQVLEGGHVQPGVEATDKSRGTLIPFSIVEGALRLHVRKKLGRRTLGAQVSGLGEWAAGQILRWHKVGKPAGLWLDEHDRLQWGPAVSPVWGDEQGREQGWEQKGQGIAPTPSALRLPRI
jgi:hypothetical protein